ncbi:PREDICTED: serine/arginine repetitive matrix protein 1-like [Branchiostoma belcheri]|uniref:Serine/arginine repetitive matrix protein 1-like n=1 Tax=Branchiostoma belcheri TaxID=7741 RepID=A0A6P4Y8G4_BRABE|nr:PREDICTED: serine/arginine repetitive matrix protein 1-like [Branchiostoma belcheri]
MAAVQRQTSQQWGHVEEESDRREHYEKEWWKWKGQTRADVAHLRKGDAAASQASQGGPGTWPGFRQNIPTFEQLHSVAPPVATTSTGIPPGGDRPPSPTPPWREGKKFISRRTGPTIISVSTEELRHTVHTRAQSKLPPPQKYEQPVQNRPSAPPPQQQQAPPPQPVKVANTPRMAEAPTNTPAAAPQAAPAHLSAQARADYEAAEVVGHVDLSGYANVVYDLHVDKGKLARTVDAASKRVRSRGASASGSASATREGSPVRELGAAGEAGAQQSSAAAAASAAPSQAQASAAAATQKTTSTTVQQQQTSAVSAQQQSASAAASVLESSSAAAPVSSQDAAAGGGQPSWTVRGSAQGGGGAAGGGGRRVFVGRPSDFVPDHLRPTIRATPGQRSRYIKTYSYVAKHQLME